MGLLQQLMLYNLPKLSPYDPSQLTTATLCPPPLFLPDRLKNLLSNLPKLKIQYSAPALEGFPKFAILDRKCRIIIWRYASHFPRQLLLTDNWHKRIKVHASIDNQNKPPVVLHTSKEAQQEGLVSYTACMKRCSPHGPIHDETGHRFEGVICKAQIIYINFAVHRFFGPDHEDKFLVHTKLQLETIDIARIQIADLPFKEENDWKREFVPLLKDPQELNVLVDLSTKHVQGEKVPLTLALQVLDRRRSFKRNHPLNLDSMRLAQRSILKFKFTSRDEDLDPVPTHADFTS